MVTGFYDLPEKRVYYGTDGAMVFGDFEINGDWYYFRLRDGAMVTGWKSDSDQTKYYDSDGKRVCGEIEIDGETYTFDDDGFLKI